MGVKRTRKEQVVEWKVLVYATYLIVLFIPNVGIGICYTKCLGGGDSKSYQRVAAGKPYGPNIAVTKFECTGQVQKRTGARLRKLVKEKRGKKIA
jgi:hypothetical protein